MVHSGDNMEITLEATKRDSSVKNVFKKSVTGNIIPAVLYDKDENHPISIVRNEFEKKMSKIASNTIINMKFEGTTRKTLIKHYTKKPGTTTLQHIDFFLINEEKDIKIKIPLETEGLCIGVTKGGVIQRFLHEVVVKCKLKDLPKRFVIDMTDLDIGSRSSIADLTAPKGVTIMDDSDRLILSVISSAKATAEKNSGEATEDGDDEASEEKPEESADKAETGK